MKILIAPDSFKGTLSAVGICEIIREEIVKISPETEVVSLPVADGGEGSLDAFLSAAGGGRIYVKASDPYFCPKTACYGIINGDCAIIELAEAAGLPLKKPEKRVSDASTYGVGELISDALKRGYRKLIVALGGSATNDGGAGLLSALGVTFYNGNRPFVPVGGTLESITEIDTSLLDGRLKSCDITVMCDVTNPLFGENGAAFVFAPQKGADENEVLALDRGLRHFAELTDKLFDGPPTQSGDGAAGGVAYGVRRYLGGKLKSGIDVVLSAAGFDDKLKDADLVLTGEGRLDSQSLQGKVASGIARRAAAFGVPVIAVVGCVRGDRNELKKALGLKKIVVTNEENLPFEEVKKQCERQLRESVKNIFTQD